MSNRIAKSTAVAALVVGALMAAPVAAQETAARADAKKDWAVFKLDSPKECWIASQPTPGSSVAKRGGKVVSVNRGEILLMVSYRPGDGVKGEVSFTGGYPFKKSSTVNVRIGSNAFEFFAEGDWAWPASAGEDGKVVNAMRRGSSAVVTALSQRGTETTDTFSLLGFTAALEQAQKLCQ